MLDIKHIIKYISCTFIIGLWYSINTICEITTYTDIDWVGNIGSRKVSKDGAFM